MSDTLKHWLFWLVTCRGKRLYLTSAILGVFATLAFAPLYLLPLLFIGFSGLLLLLAGATSKKQAFHIGWWFGFGHFVSGIYWMAYALLTDAEQFGWLVPFAVFGISAVLALYCAIVALLTYSVGLKSPVSRVIVFSVFWVAGEVARTYLLSGFPWNLVGYVWTFSDALSQLASVIGIYGLSLLTILVAGSLAACVGFDTEKNRLYRGSRIFSMAMLAILILNGGWGYYRLAHAEEAFEDDIMLRIVQGNIKQTLKWLPEQRELNLQKYIDLSLSKGFDQTTYVIWPETAVPYAIKKDNPELMEILKLATPAKGALLTGAIRLEMLPENDYNVWNSFFVLTKEGIYSYYDKQHLVPFGEYIPFHSLLPGFINKITAGAKDFATGPGPKPIALPGGDTILPLICYEGIFPQYVDGAVKEPYSWVLNVTNDAWFGVSSGPYQHLNMVRMRAVEQGVPLVRAANTGISAIFDSYGRMLSYLPLNETGILDSKLPKKLINNTIYSKYGNATMLPLIVVCGLLILLVEKIHKNTRVYY